MDGAGQKPARGTRSSRSHFPKIGEEPEARDAPRISLAAKESPGTGELVSLGGLHERQVGGADGHDGLRALEVVLAAYRSGESHEPVAIGRVYREGSGSPQTQKGGAEGSIAANLTCRGDKA